MNDPVDVLIIGAGASGAAVAWSLAETKMHILCLEQGDWMTPANYPSAGRDWEARAYGDYSPSPNVRARPEAYPINDDNSPIKVVNLNGVGGSTIMYTAHFPRLHPSDFRVRTLDGVAEDWPIDYDTLAPFFAENDRMMGVSGLSGDPAFPPTEPPMPPLPLGRSGARLAKAMNKLGWHWWPSDTACKFQRTGRQKPDVPSLRSTLRLCGRADRQQPCAADLPVEQAVLRDRSLTRLCAWLCVPVRPRRRACGGSRHERGQGHLALGSGAPQGIPPAQRPSPQPGGDLRGSAGGA